MSAPESKVDKTMRIVEGSSGSFLCPPGHPMLSWSIEAGPGRNTRRGPNLIAGLDYALKDEYGDVPVAIQQRAAQLYAEANLVMSEKWLRHTYAYFRGCYSPDGVDRNVSHCLIIGQGEPYYPKHPKVLAEEVKLSQYDSLNRGPIVAADDPRCTPDHHLALLLVRKYFPDAEPRLDLIADASGGYGTAPCVKCGIALQYEAKFDAFVRFVSDGIFHQGYETACPKGGSHSEEPVS